MPGLSGRSGGHAAGDAAEVARLLQHFPFYRAGTVGDDGAWLGWTGIGDEERHLLHDEERGVLAAYHGDGVEQVDAPSAAARLEAVVRLAAASPLGLAESCDGSFAAARYDLRSGELVLVSDPFGHHRIYYLQRGDVLHFAPELKGLLGWRDLQLTADPAALRDMMNYTYPLGDRTSLTGVKLLPPASVLRFAAGELRVESYWRPRYEPVEGDDAELVARGYELFAQAFRDKVAPGRRLTVPVSGGVDSRLLLAEAGRRGHPLQAYTYGHSRSREARVALQVMAACDAGDRFIVLDDFPAAGTALETTSWFVEGMVHLGISALVGVNHHLLEAPRDALFLNGIYGGPTNFSNAYHRPSDLVTDLTVEEKLRRVGLKMFSASLHDAKARSLMKPDFAQACADAYYRELGAAFAPCQEVSDLFGHQLDAFMIANRMCRFMNQVDLNRYYWDSTIPLTSFSLYRFYLRLSDRLKFNRLLHRRIVAGEFPAVAGVENFNSGRSLHEELAGAPPRRRSGRGEKLRYWLGRATRGALAVPDAESYQAPDHYLRRNRELREFVGDVLNDPGFLADDVFERRVVRGCFDRTLRGARLATTVYKVLAWELWLRQVKTGRREVG